MLSNSACHSSVITLLKGHVSTRLCISTTTPSLPPSLPPFIHPSIYLQMVRPEANTPAFFPSVNPQKADRDQEGFIPFSNYDSDYVRTWGDGLCVCMCVCVSKWWWLWNDIAVLTAQPPVLPIHSSHMYTHRLYPITTRTGLLVHRRATIGQRLRHGRHRRNAHRVLRSL